MRAAPAVASVTPRPRRSSSRSESDSTDSDAESGIFGCVANDSDEDNYSDKNISQVPAYIRRQFVQKVYAILVVQLIVTIAVAFPFQFVSNEWLRNTIWLYWVAMVGSLLIILGMACCCSDAAKTFPTNYLMLFVFTLLEGVIIGFISAMYETQSVVLAAGLTAGIFLGLTAYACCTKTDFTGCGPYLFAALLGLILFGLVLAVCSFFMEISRLPRLMFGFLGAVLFSFYIIFDTQLIVGGRHKRHEFSVDEYIFAALNLYLDVVNLFLHILSIIGGRS